MKTDDVFPDKSILERKQKVLSEKLNNMSMEELIYLILFINIFGDFFLNKEIENAKQNPEKMNILPKPSGSICIDTSKMEYVENESDC